MGGDLGGVLDGAVVSGALDALRYKSKLQAPNPTLPTPTPKNSQITIPKELLTTRLGLGIWVRALGLGWAWNVDFGWDLGIGSGGIGAWSLGFAPFTCAKRMRMLENAPLRLVGKLFAQRLKFWGARQPGARLKAVGRRRVHRARPWRLHRGCRRAQRHRLRESWGPLFTDTPQSAREGARGSGGARDSSAHLRSSKPGWHGRCRS